MLFLGNLLSGVAKVADEAARRIAGTELVNDGLDQDVLTATAKPLFTTADERDRGRPIVYGPISAGFRGDVCSGSSSFCFNPNMR